MRVPPIQEGTLEQFLVRIGWWELNLLYEITPLLTLWLCRSFLLLPKALLGKSANAFLHVSYPTFDFVGGQVGEMIFVGKTLKEKHFDTLGRMQCVVTNMNKRIQEGGETLK